MCEPAGVVNMLLKLEPHRNTDRSVFHEGNCLGYELGWPAGTEVDGPHIVGAQVDEHGVGGPAAAEVVCRAGGVLHKKQHKDVMLVHIRLKLTHRCAGAAQMTMRL